ncbi:hypothetical protein LO771_27670 [Streptacidiphilus sp. ASG 303]|uniref:hypothetical protein n=1 Tax=Streptacidiphilus sp. ASG 303 TaxID=2896847 RepID=UPI001E612AA6|nr:hypothetical protein [Streptacidiphilus sp. ASG 303]MCD0486063.1 hypothetical protein [Streptacidiphilus sp. ASG 303]
MKLRGRGGWGVAAWASVLVSVAGIGWSARALAESLSTPWRLTLAVVVFQERDASGTYKRSPALLITLA